VPLEAALSPRPSGLSSRRYFSVGQELPVRLIARENRRPASGFALAPVPAATHVGVGLLAKGACSLLNYALSRPDRSRSA